MDGSEAFRRDHQAVWELLPWHLNGTLDPADRARVEAHLAACPDCRAALAGERDLARAVRGADPLDAMAERSLAAIMPRLAGGAAPVARRPRGPWLLRGVALAQAAALALAVMALLRPEAAPPPQEYTTLTAPGPAGAAPRIAVLVAGTTTEAALRARLLGLGLRIVGGPDPAGRYDLAPADAALGAWPAPLLAAIAAAPEWRPAEAPAR